MSSYTNSQPGYKSVSERVNTTFDVLEDIITTFKKEGCPHSLRLLRECLLRNHLEGGPSTDSSRLTEVIDNAKIGREII
jgi:hypothetical protein